MSTGEGEFRTGRDRIGQIVNMRIIIEKILARERRVYTAFLDLEKAYNKRMGSNVGRIEAI